MLHCRVFLPQTHFVDGSFIAPSGFILSESLVISLLPFSNLRNLAVFVDVIVRDPIFSSRKSLQATVEDFKLPSHHMDRQNIPFMLFGIIRFFRMFPEKLHSSTASRIMICSIALLAVGSENLRFWIRTPRSSSFLALLLYSTSNRI